MTVSQQRTGQPDWLTEAMDLHYDLLQQLHELQQLRERVNEAETLATEVPRAVRHWRGMVPE